MILLTGASGFIGKHLLKALVKEYGASNILALTSKPINECAYLLHHNYTFDERYFLRHGFADKIHTIIHAGAFIPKRASQGDDWRQCSKNISTLTLLLATYLPALKKFIYISSTDVYKETSIITEESEVEPMSLYGYSKLYGEKMVVAWANATKKIYQILRLGHVYGPGEEQYQKIIPVTMGKIINNNPLEMRGTGEELRAFIFIEDVVKAILASLTFSVSTGITNLVSSQSVSVKELVNKIMHVSNRSVNINLIPANGARRNLVFDNKKMKNLLLLEETPLIDGLTKEWQYMNSKQDEYFF